MERVEDSVIDKFFTLAITQPENETDELTNQNDESLKEESSLERLARLIKDGEIKKIIVMCGAGISVSCGIPDFRSSDGLYAKVKKDFPWLNRPEDIFSLPCFHRNPNMLYKILSEINLDEIKPSLTHAFFKLLDDKNMLTRVYTQNIDNLEEKAGLCREKIIQAHGTLATASCPKKKIQGCKHTIPFSQLVKAHKENTVCYCPVHPHKVCRPDIVFMQEQLPSVYYKTLRKDLSIDKYRTSPVECDLLMVIGTSLSIEPFSIIMHQVPSYSYRILINRDRVGEYFYYTYEQYKNRRPFIKDTPFDFDSHSRDMLALGNCDDTILELCTLLGWEKELYEIYNSFINKKS